MFNFKVVKVKYIFFVLVIFVFISCKKDKDDIAPTISITVPNNMQLVSGIDTILVEGDISDNRIVTSVTIAVEDANHVRVLPAITKTPNAPSYHLKVFFIFDDIHLSSNIYTFDISAFDGNNTTHRYIDVNYGEVAQQRNGIFIFDNNVTNTTISLLDNALNTTFFNTLNGDFIGGDVNSYDQQIYSIGNYSGNFVAFDILNNNNLWQLQAANSTLPYFTGYYYNNRINYVGFYDGTIKFIANNGIANITTQAYSNFYQQSALVHDNLLISEQHNKFNNEVRLLVYWLVSGVNYQQVSVNEDVVGMYNFTSNKVVFFTNDASNIGKVKIYDILANNFTNVFNLNAGKIDAATEISSGVYIIAKNGDLVIVNTNNNSQLNYLTGVTATLLRYDKLTQQLFVVNGNSLQVYDYNSKTLVGNYIHNAVIKNIAFWYNK